MAATQYRTLKNLSTNYQRCLDDMTALFHDLTDFKGNRWPTSFKITEIALNRTDGKFYFKVTDPFPLSYDLTDFNVELWPGAIPTE